jgi:RNA-directed DNA polymerase
MDKGELFSSKAGTPQSGSISPLLANIALHRMEKLVKDFAEGLKLLYPNGSYLSKELKRRSLHLIRYADDFVCMHEDLSVVLHCKEIIAEWLGTLGLSLKPSKTRLVHTLKSHQGSSPGFDFLGFNIRQYPVGKYHSRRGYKTLIKPSKDSQIVHYRRLGQNKHCHHCKTRQDNLNLVKNLGTYDKSCITEERSEGKLSRSVLQTSRRGDSSA